MMAFYRSPDGVAVAAKGSFRIALSAREWVLIVLAGMIWAFFNAGFVLAPAFGPDFLADAGYSLARAGLIASLSMWVGAPALILGGYVADRLGPPNIVIAICLLLAMSAIAAITAGLSPLLWFSLLGLLIGLPGGLIMKLPVSVLASENRSVGMGVFFACFYAGMATLPPLAGWLRDATGSSAAPLWFAAATLIAALFFLGLFLVADRRWSRQG